MSRRPDDRAATFDELLGDGFETAAAAAGDARRAEDRLSAWCGSSTDGDWRLFTRRLARDGWTVDRVRARLAAARRRDARRAPHVDDLDWIRRALGRRGDGPAGPFPFAHIFLPLVDQADRRLPGSPELAPSARGDLRNLLLADLTGLCAPVLFDRFTHSHAGYREFVDTVDMDALCDEKPVLARLIATLTRQWLDTTNEFLNRLALDQAGVRALAGAGGAVPVTRVVGGLSDRHRGGHCVLRCEFADGAQVLYKPKDLRVDAAWRDLVEWLNRQGPPVDLRAVRTLAREGYGWAEFVDHTGCPDARAAALFFRRAGAWLALLHCLAGADMHHENLIASGEHPVPVDLEATLQPVDPTADRGPHYWAYDAARELIADSVLAVGLLPGYARVAGREAQPVGGFAAGWSTGDHIHWHDVNSDTMRPERTPRKPHTPNLPHVAGDHVGLAEHVEDFLRGFGDYAAFLAGRDWTAGLAGFGAVTVRKVHRPTQFYHLLLGRLRDDRTMGDGVTWSMQADFLARLADWNAEPDPMWELQRTERDALVELNVPVFEAPPGLSRVRARLDALDDREIAWQVDVIRQTSSFVAVRDRPPGWCDAAAPLCDDELGAEADAIAEEVARHAVRRGPGAAWPGLNWFPESDAAQLAVLGHDLYNGSCGIALFLAAHARIRGSSASADLAVAALARLRAELVGHNASHLARLLGIGGATGLGSVVYALTVTATLLRDDGLRDDAVRAAALITDALIAADTRFDVVAGSAGAALALLRLHADTGAPQILARAVSCGDRMLRHNPPGPGALDGMSHGAAGFAHALAALSEATGRRDYRDAALAWVEHERSRFDGDAHARAQWCHGAAGIGLARLAMADRGVATPAVCDDIDWALRGAERVWPGHVDTLCCGALGGIELFRAAARGDVAAQRLSSVIANRRATGSYRWNGGATRFNIGLFRGLSGVGYTCLRGIDAALPNVLVWG